MDMNSGVNPAQSDSVRADLYIETETVTFQREPPPPYDVIINNAPVANQPVIQTIIIQPTLKNSPMFYNCPTCGERILTNVAYKNTRKTHMLAGFICGFTLWCSLCCLAAIPYLAKTFKKAHHYCPICNTYLGGKDVKGVGIYFTICRGYLTVCRSRQEILSSPDSRTAPTPIHASTATGDAEHLGLFLIILWN